MIYPVNGTKFLPVLLYSAFGFLPLTQSASAADAFWKNIPTGSFSTPGNWFGGVPGSSDTAWFTNNSLQRVDWTASAANANAVFSSTAGVLTQAIGSSRWTITNSYTVSATVGSSSTVHHISGTLAVTNPAQTAQMIMGGAGIGEYKLEGGAAIVDRLISTNPLQSIIEFPHGRLTSRADGLLIATNTPEGGNAELRLGVTAGKSFRWDITGGRVKVSDAIVTYLGQPADSKGTLTITGPDSQFEGNYIVIGVEGRDNQLVITNGGRVSTPFATLGRSDNNSVLVTDPGSQWQLRAEGFSSSVSILGTSNRVTVEKGGYLEVDHVDLSGDHGTVVVRGDGSRIESVGDEVWGGTALSGYNNEIVISERGLFRESQYLTITQISGDNNRVTVTSGGRLIVTNDFFYDGFSPQGLRIGSSLGKGTLVIDGGIVEANFVEAIDPDNSIIVFQAGTLTASRISLNYERDLLVGDGTRSAILNLKAGDTFALHSFGSLIVSSNATLNISGPNSEAGGTIIVTNGLTSRVNLESGTLFPNQIIVSNGLPFRLGHGLAPAKMVLFQNKHVFADGLVVSSNSTLFSIHLGPETLVVHGNLNFDLGSGWKFLLGYTTCPQSNNTLHVAGNVGLRTLIDVAGASRFVPASQPLFTYSGTLATNGVSFTNVPPGYVYSIDTSNPGEARLKVEFTGPLPTGTLANVVRCDTMISISFATVLGQTYRLEYTDDLNSAIWTEFKSVTGTGNVVSVIDSEAGDSERFYRFKNP